MTQEPFKTLKGRSKETTECINAYSLVAGATCFVLVLKTLLYRFFEYGSHPLLTGLDALCGLCYPLLYLWGGVLLRLCFKRMPHWLTGVAAGTAIVFMLLYCSLSYGVTHIGFLYAAMLSFGFLMKATPDVDEDKQHGWFSLLWVIISIVCFTAVTVVEERLLIISFNREQADLEILLTRLLLCAEPLLALMCAYFVMRFTVSEWGRRIASCKVFKWVAAVVCCLSFIFALVNAMTLPLHIHIGYVDYVPLLRLLIQPAIIYLIVRLACRYSLTIQIKRRLC